MIQDNPWGARPFHDKCHLQNPMMVDLKPKNAIVINAYQKVQCEHTVCSSLSRQIYGSANHRQFPVLQRHAILVGSVLMQRIRETLLQHWIWQVLSLSLDLLFLEWWRRMRVRLTCGLRWIEGSFSSQCFEGATRMVPWCLIVWHSLCCFSNSFCASFSEGEKCCWWIP